ncbi:hypothetical protein DFH08DRAFT_807286 [Mycena albidolilacea]|uniref:Uncharacterized protein n=1 Tax=Mycena albidolilacea TaxID=1033008 RepID=A0AAD7EV14_9AGAR|nr:hypothetical protein DFH08DRAFT_807286 [Mycena albidolilacea]
MAQWAFPWQFRVVFLIFKQETIKEKFWMQQVSGWINKILLLSPPMNLPETVNQVDWIAPEKILGIRPSQACSVFQHKPAQHHHQQEFADSHAVSSHPGFEDCPQTLNQTDTVSEDDSDIDSDIAEEVFTESDLYDDCDTPLNVVTDLLRSGAAPAIATDFKVMEEGGITHAGDAELPDAEDAEREPRGHGLRKKTAARRYLGPAWEEH